MSVMPNFTEIDNGAPLSSYFDRLFNSWTIDRINYSQANHIAVKIHFIAFIGDQMFEFNRLIHKRDVEDGDLVGRVSADLQQAMSYEEIPRIFENLNCELILFLQRTDRKYTLLRSGCKGSFEFYNTFANHLDQEQMMKKYASYREGTRFPMVQIFDSNNEFVDPEKEWLPCSLLLLGISVNIL